MMLKSRCIQLTCETSADLYIYHQSCLLLFVCGLDFTVVGNDKVMCYMLAIALQISLVDIFALFPVSSVVEILSCFILI